MNQTRNLTRSDGSLDMEEKKLDSDAFELIYNRYIKDDPARVVSFQEELTDIPGIFLEKTGLMI